MKRYEFKSIPYQGWALASFIKHLNEAGAQGWQLVATLPNSHDEGRIKQSGHVIMQREIVPENRFKGKPISELSDEEREEYRKAEVDFGPMALS